MGSTTLDPGESTTVKVTMLMHKGMGGKHLFQVSIPSNDPDTSSVALSVKANYIES